MTTASQNPSGGQGPGASQGANGANADLKAAANTLAEQAKTQGKQQVETARNTSAESLEKIAHSISAAASDLKEHDAGQLSGYVSTMAESLNGLATRLRDKNGGELVEELTRVGRENPGLFLTGSIAIGFGLARFIRASSQATASQDGASQNLGSTGADTRSFGSHAGASSSSSYGARSLDATGGSASLGGNSGSSGLGGSGSAGYAAGGAAGLAASGGAASGLGASSASGSTGSSSGSPGSSSLGASSGSSIADRNEPGSNLGGSLNAGGAGQNSGSDNLGSATGQDFNRIGRSGSESSSGMSASSGPTGADRNTPNGTRSPGDPGGSVPTENGGVSS